MTFSIQRIDHVVLRVHDLDRMIRFYEQALGCHVERRLDKLQLVQLRAGACLLDLVKSDAPRSGANMDHLCFRVDPFSLPDIQQALQPFGITAGDVVQRYGAEGDGPSIYFDDPEGNQIELKGPATSPPLRR
ncbi:VOC family protein [Reyranella sp. CPCC 100927]|uniref:VOC family protein n=1 Tax=Reyranella sp. CPCC 100927 TaxID=2599616 RepID=UPI0011B3B7E1|nr:VOC family protein [Reyranella sp. CPCC 100927]TWT03872.1 VOC family protein [Reyranella sp. CPCC 100927]